MVAKNNISPTVTTLNVLHFNDVNKMTTPQKKGGVDITEFGEDGRRRPNFGRLVNFASRIDSIRDGWEKQLSSKHYLEPDGLLLFSGDLFSPSAESALTRGRNMVHVMNELSPDACVPGNHEFDFGMARFKELTGFCNFPWIASNLYPGSTKDKPAGPKKEENQPHDEINKQKDESSESTGDVNGESEGKNGDEQEILVDDRHEADLASEKGAKSEAKSEYEPGRTPVAGLLKYLVLKRAGLTIGLIGVISDDTWKSILKASRKEMKVPEQMRFVCEKLSAYLRKEEKCDLVFALTHAKHNEDLDLAVHLNAYPADCKTLKDSGTKLEDLDGVDAIFGGHDHDYFLGKGVEWHGERGDGVKAPGIQSTIYDKDKRYDDLLVVKSGTDFEDFSEVKIQVEDRNGAVRRKVIKSLTVVRHHHSTEEVTDQATFQDPKKESWPETRMSKMLTKQYDHHLMNDLNYPMAKAFKPVAIDEDVTKKEETIIGNWIAKTILEWVHSQKDNLKSGTPPMVFVMTGGTIRGKGYLGDGNGVITKHRLLQLMPFESTMVVLEMTGQELWDEIDGALTYVDSKTGEGRTHFPVIGGFKLKWYSNKSKGDSLKEIILLNPDGSESDLKFDREKTYRVLTNTFLAEGGCSFNIFREAKRRMDEAAANGQGRDRSVSALPTWIGVGLYQPLIFRLNDLRKSKSTDFQTHTDAVNNLDSASLEKYEEFKILHQKAGSPHLRELYEKGMNELLPQVTNHHASLPVITFEMGLNMLEDLAPIPYNLDSPSK